jgi:hypothetical protein
LLHAFPARAQEAAAANAAPPTKLLRLQITFIDFDGEKKISSLPYTLHLSANSDPNRKLGETEKNERSSLRMGLRVPVMTGSAPTAKDPQFTYVDMGTNIDCQVVNVSDGMYTIEITADRTTAASDNAFGPDAAVATVAGDPIFQHFTVDTPVVLRDGQTTTSTIGTDPIGGRVVRMEVTLNEEK